MEYSAEQIRTLVERWLAADTTLAEERALRDYFGGTEKELPADLAPCRPMFGQSARAAGEGSRRKLVLHTEPTRETASPRQAMPQTLRWTWRHATPLFRRIAATTAVAAAVAAALVLFVPPQGATRGSVGGDIVCVVNGVRITDPGEIAAYARQALEIASDNLRRPGELLSTELNDEPAMTRVGEMLNELSKDQ